MSWFIILGLVAFLIISMLSGMRIAFAMALVGILSLYLAAGTSGFVDLGYSCWNAMNSFIIVAIPLFLLMGNILKNSGLADSAYTDLTSWIHFVPGRLLISNIAACSIFAAISGSSLATMVTIGNVAIPMLRNLCSA
ncbi:C4-dicarboxylate TRAP transporter large permease protein DctM [subsurface metagenome]